MLLLSLINDDFRHDSMVMAGTYTEKVEEKRNSVRWEKEERLINTHSTNPYDFAAKLRVVWSTLAECAYSDGPKPHHELALHRLFYIVKELEQIPIKKF